MNVAPAALALEDGDVLARFVKVASLLDELRAELADRAVLVGVVARRYDDRAAHAEVPRRKGERLAVIASRDAEDARGFFLG